MVDMKKCSKCKETKPLSEFSKDEKSPDKHAYWCKTCYAEYRKKKWDGAELIKIIGNILFPSASNVNYDKKEISAEYTRDNLIKDFPDLLKHKIGFEQYPQDGNILITIKTRELASA